MGAHDWSLSKMRHDILKHFAYAHLPPRLAEVSAPFGNLAQSVAVTLPDGDEKALALRKLLEAKDCAVRARLEDKT